MAALSGPVEVFSHTLYLQNPDGTKVAKSVPAVREILPLGGKKAGGTRCVLIGHGFENTERVCVKFGDKVQKAQFHEEGAVLVTTPAFATPACVPVRVSNDGEHWSETVPPLWFTFV